MFDFDGVYSLVDNLLVENFNLGLVMGCKVFVYRVINVIMVMYDKFNDKFLEFGWCFYF